LEYFKAKEEVGDGVEDFGINFLKLRKGLDKDISLG